MKKDLALWAELMAGPVVWFVALCTGFALAPWTCAMPWKPVPYAVWTVALLITAVAGFAAWNRWRTLGRDFPGEAAGSVARSRALASGGVLLNAMFFVVIVAQFTVAAVLGPCE